MFFKATCCSNLQDIITPLNIRFCTALIFNFFVNVNSCFIIRTEVGISHGRNVNVMKSSSTFYSI